MRREVPAATKGYGGLGRSSGLERLKESASDATTPVILRDAELNNSKAILTRGIKQVPNELSALDLGTKDVSPVQVVGERFCRKKAKSSAITLHQVIDGN